MATTQIKKLDSEVFRTGDRVFFVDLLEARNKRPYLQITRAKHQNDKLTERTSVILFEDDFEFFVEAVAMVMRRYSHGERRTA
jgi:hypothetical protein